MVIGEVKWRDVRTDLPKTNELVFAIYVDPFMGKVTEQIGLAYFEKKKGWFFDGTDKPIKRVAFWSEFPDLPADPRFDGITTTEFDSKYSSDMLGNLGPKTVRRKRGGEKPKDTPERDVSILDVVNLQRKHSRIPTRKNESYMDKIRAVNTGKRR